MDIIKETNNDSNGHYSLEIDNGIVNLVVIKANDDIKLTIGSINDYLRHISATAINEQSIKKAVDNPGEKTVVAKIEKPEIDIYIEDADMTAYAYIAGNTKYASVDREDILSALNKSGVIYGIDNDAIETTLKHPGSRHLVARGKAVIDGTDARIDFKEEIDLENKGRPKELEGGRVDYKNLDLFSAVLENQIIAEKIPLTTGEDGQTVKGKVLKAIAGRDKRIKTGRNILVEENLFLAKISGNLSITSDKIDVLPVLEIKSDVDLSTGNINFPGDVNVRGNVQAGFFVKAQGAVTINGSVYGAIIEGESVDVKHGIQGSYDSYVKAVKSVTAKFVENATIYSEGNIVIADSILHSKVSAGGKVVMTGSKGLIAGGHVSAGVEIDAKNIGTQMAPPTVIEVGVNPVLKDEFITLKDKYKDTVAKQEGVKKSLQLIKPTETTIVPQGRQELFIKLTKSNFAMLGEIDEMKKRLIFIEEEFSKIGNGKIKCYGNIFPGVKLIISNVVYPVRDVIQHSLFHLDNGEIRFAVYS